MVPKKEIRSKITQKSDLTKVGTQVLFSKTQPQKSMGILQDSIQLLVNLKYRLSDTTPPHTELLDLDSSEGK